MTSSESVDDSFRARVEKVFGSIASSQFSSLRSLWSLTDDEVEKREWKRDRDDETPCSSSFDGRLLTKDRGRILEKHSRSIREELNDDDDDDDGGGQLGGGYSNQSFKRGDGDDNQDEWEIRSSIGLDCTLDNEEEEDEYDKVAEGRENAGDRLYMRDVTDHGPYLNSHNLLPNSVYDACRDPRANHFAARIRLKDDEAGSEKFDSRCDKSMPSFEEPCIKASEDGGKPKSILKKKDNAAGRSSKRVRFDPACKDDCEEASKKHQDSLTPSKETKASDDDYLLAKNMPTVPDYALNPSKYTRYSFDSSGEIDTQSNSRACMDFLELVERPKPIMLGWKSEDTSTDLLKSVTFIPRKKASNAKAVNGSSEVKQNHEEGSKQPLTRTGFPVGIAAGETRQSEVSAMQDNEPETEAVDRSGGFQKPGRCYRTKLSLQDSVS